MSDITPLVLVGSAAVMGLGLLSQATPGLDLSSWIQTGGTVAALLYMTWHMRNEGMLNRKQYEGSQAELQRRYDALVDKMDARYKENVETQLNTAVALAGFNSTMRHMRNELVITRNILIDEPVGKKIQERLRQVEYEDQTPVKGDSNHGKSV